MPFPVPRAAPYSHKESGACHSRFRAVIEIDSPAFQPSAFRAAPAIPLQTPPHPEKTFFVSRSSRPPEFPDPAGRFLRRRKMGNTSAFHVDEIQCLGRPGLRPVANPDNSSFFNRAVQIRRTPVSAAADLLERSCGR